MTDVCCPEDRCVICRREELLITWACRNNEHLSCGGLGMRLLRPVVDIPCICRCHEQKQPALGVEAE